MSAGEGNKTNDPIDFTHVFHISASCYFSRTGILNSVIAACMVYEAAVKACIGQKLIHFLQRMHVS